MFKIFSLKILLIALGFFVYNQKINPDKIKTKIANKSCLYDCRVLKEKKAIIIRL